MKALNCCLAPLRLNTMTVNKIAAAMPEVAVEAIDAAALFAAVLCWGALQAGAAAREAVWSLRRFEGR